MAKLNSPSLEKIETDVLVVGGGPAGIASAVTVARCGKKVLLVDDNPFLGGQIWRGGFNHLAPKEVNEGKSSRNKYEKSYWQAELAKELAAASKEILDSESAGQEEALPRKGLLALLPSAQVTCKADLPSGKRGLFLQQDLGASGKEYFTKETKPGPAGNRKLLVTFESLIMAVGARERFLPFEGWTLPGVFGAGGLQAMVKMGLEVRGKTVVLAGTGPLLLAVAELLQDRGAKVLQVAEQAPLAKVATLGKVLLKNPAKLRQGIALKWKLRKIPFSYQSWPIKVVRQEAEDGPTRGIESQARQKAGHLLVTLQNGKKVETHICDYLGCGFGLIANLELPTMFGCAQSGDFVTVDAKQQTSIAGLFAAGEVTGVGGVEKAVVEGEIAAYAACGHLDDVERLQKKREANLQFANALANVYSLCQEVKQLATDETCLCRCEGVTAGEMKKYTNWRGAKLLTRCGMGPCQGRICRPIAKTIFQWEEASSRPPLFPVELGHLDDCLAYLEELGKREAKD